MAKVMYISCQLSRRCSCWTLKQYEQQFVLLAALQSALLLDAVPFEDACNGAL